MAPPPPSSSSPAPPPTDAGARWRRVLVAAAVVGAGALAGVLAERALRPPAAPPPTLVRTLLDVRPAEEVDSGALVRTGTLSPGGSRTALAWTPDGRALVFVGRRGDARQSFVRELDRDEARPLAGTEGAHAMAVSTDGQWVTFWAGGAIRRVPTGGGPVSTVVSGVGDAPRGMASSASGEVFYDGADGVVWRASAERAKAPVTKRLESEILHALPALLRGERVLLFTVRHRQWTWGDEEVVAQRLDTGERKALLRDATDARYVPSGHLVFLRRGTLLAVPFDAARLEVRGDPVAVVERVRQGLTGGHGGDFTGAGHFSVSSNGTLAYLAGEVAPFAEREIVAIDRSGRVSPLPAPSRGYAVTLGLSPDGRHLAVVTNDLSERALWLLDVARGTLDKLTPEGEAFWPRFTPDGRRVAFSWLKAGHQGLAWQDLSAALPPEVRVPDDPGMLSSWTPDGRQLALVKSGDIWVARLGEPGASLQQVTQTPQDELWPEFSPDGRWLAYASNVSGRFEVYVQPWPGPGPREQVTLDGGQSPAWSAGGDELFRVQVLELDELPPGAKDRERLIRWRLEKGAAFDTSNTILRYQVLPREDKGFSVLACVAKQEVIEQYEELLTALGFEPWLVGPSSFNAVNFYASSIAERGVRGYALVWITDTSSATVVWDRGGPRFYRSKEFRAGAPEDVAVRLQRELDDSLHFYTHMDRQQQTEVGHLYLDGDSSALAPLAKAMTEATNLTVEILSPSVVLSSAGADAAAMAAAFGAWGGQ